MHTNLNKYAAEDMGYETPCWIWKGSISPYGYAQVSVHGRQHRAHRLAYQTTYGDIDTALVIDHKCEQKNCINPDHLEPVTQLENVARHYRKRYGTGRILRENVCDLYCPHGHRITAANIKIITRENGRKAPLCRICDRAAKKRYKQKARANGKSK